MDYYSTDGSFISSPLSYDMYLQIDKIVVVKPVQSEELAMKPTTSTHKNA